MNGRRETAERAREIAILTTISTDLTDCSTPEIRSLTSYWAARKRGHDLPLLSDIDPSDLGPMLSRLLLSDIEYGPFRVRFRLVGSAVADWCGREFTGQYLDDLLPGQTAARWRDVHRLAAVERRPVFGRTTVDETSGARCRRVLTYASAVLPLGDRTNGLTVGHCLGIEDLSLLSSADRIALRRQLGFGEGPLV